MYKNEELENLNKNVSDIFDETNGSEDFFRISTFN